MKSEAKKQAQKREEARKHEAKKRELKQQEAKKRTPRKVEEEPCLYCGEPTLCRDYIINPGAKHELPSCSKECFEKTKNFVTHDKRYRTPFYAVLFVLVVANLFLLGFETPTRWKYLPMLGVSIAAFVWPLIFTRYERYQKFGIRKSRIIIRVIAAALAAFSVLLIVSY